MKHRSVIAICFFFCFSFVWAQGGWYQYNASEVKKLEYIALAQGALNPFTVFPFDSTDVLILAQTANVPFEQTINTNIVFGLGIEFNPAIYSAFSFDSYTINNGSWKTRKPIILVPVTMQYADWFTAFVQYDIREDHNTLEYPGAPNNWSNIPDNFEYIDFTAPFEAWIGLQKSVFSILAGRYSARIGNGYTGSLVLSDAADFYDTVRVQYKLPGFAYTIQFISIYPLVNNSELASKITTWQKNALYHHIDVMIGKRIAIGLTEAMMIGGMDVPLAAFNPLMIFHDLFLWNHIAGVSQGFMPASSFLSAEIRINPWKYIELYGSFAMNQFQTDFEKSYYQATTIPNAIGFLAGIKTAIPFGDGWFTGVIEYVYTNPWLYIRENELNSWFWYRALTSNYAGATQAVTMPLGYPTGPDSIVFSISLGYEIFDKLRVSASFASVTRGENNAYTPYEESEHAVNLKTPTGIPERLVKGDTSCTYSFSQLFSIFAQLEYLYYTNFTHIDGLIHEQLNVSLGLVLKLCYERKIE
ncbi:MAG TPA: hypothetical protein P5519_03885 [Spirochaetia bacterium]|nr:hypothetical protein [Spirochaetales bacterium]HRS65011.1 hypothetical protein [Spirochaetia bacterium]HRV27506.1 hypothetical protein [Spirochaetia bacterium]